MENQTTLVATLGGEPQVITFLMDLLIQRGFRMDQVVIVYLAGNERCAQSFRQVAAEFSGDRYAGQPCHLRSVPVRLGQSLLADSYQPAEVEAVRRTFHDLLRSLKAAEDTVHLGLSGGRRILSLIAAAAAALHLKPCDHLWHIYTPESLMEQARGGQVMHAAPDDGLQLIEVPFIPWAAYYPGLEELLRHSPREVDSAGMGWLNEADLRRCRRVWEALSPREQDTLRAWADGLSRKEMAARLGVAVSTVDTYREEVMQACRSVWEEDEQRFLPRFMMEKFKPFLRRLDPV